MDQRSATREGSGVAKDDARGGRETASSERGGAAGVSRQALRGMTYLQQMAALEPVQRREGDGAGGGDVHAAAARGVSGPGGSLPHAGRIQEAFGRHDVSDVQAHVGGPAAEASQAMGANAYATGGKVAFGEAPDLFTAAHEAAHVVQQRAGVQLSGGVGAVGDPYERHADAVAERVVRGETAEGLLDRGPSGGGAAGAAVQRQVKGGVAVGAKDGISVSFGLPQAKMSLKWVTLANPQVTASAKRTDATDVSVRGDDEVTGGVNVEGGGMEAKVERDKDGEWGVDAGGTGSGGKVGAEHDTKGAGSTKGTESASTPKVKAEIKKKWGSTVFTDAMGEVGASGGSVSVTTGAEWKHAVLDCKFTLLSLGADGKDIKFLTATAGATVRDVITVDGLNFSVTAKLSVDIKPNTTAIARYLVDKGIVTSMRSFGKLFGKVSALPFLLVEGGYETLKAAYKNVVASKEIPKFVDAANFTSLEVGQHFVNGVLGQSSGMGSKSGATWFEGAYKVAQAEHPDITREEFRDALRQSTSWQEQAKIAIARQIRAVLFEAFAEAQADTIAPKDLEHVKSMLFGSGDAPDTSAGPSVPVPELVKKKDPGKVDLPEDQIKSGDAPVPGAIRGEVKHRVNNHQLSGTIPYGGVNYEFRYVAASDLIEVHGGPSSSVVSHRPTWKKG